MTAAHLFHIVRDVFAVIGVLWVALTVFFACSDAAKGRYHD
jgi:hypothetical protein